MKVKEFIKENYKAIRFLTVFIGLYLVLNTLYGFFVEHYYPTCDPLTQRVSNQVVWVLRWFDPTITSYNSNFNEYIAIANNNDNLIYFFEGCNGINVMIVYLCFLIAFSGPLRLLLKFSLLGIAGIHLLNLARVGMLYMVVIYFPEQSYFFHKYLFTGILYVVVFIFWFFWIRSVKRSDAKQ